MSSSITIAYDLHPPTGTSTSPSMQTKKTLDFPVKASPISDHRQYYSSLRDAVLESKTQIGVDLTEWRDAVGTLENQKEPKKGKKSDEGEDEDEEEDGEDGI